MPDLSNLRLLFRDVTHTLQVGGRSCPLRAEDLDELSTVAGRICGVAVLVSADPLPPQPGKQVIAVPVPVQK